MSRKMLINASHSEENRVAIVVDGILSELDIEIAGQQQTKGNIYKAVVVRVEPGLQAAFVDYGAEKHGFLQTGEIHPNLHPPKKSEGKEYPRINEILQRGQEILVQVVKGERGTKGAALTTFLSLPGRYMVLMPDSDTKGVSRKIQDDKERKTLKKTMAQLDLPNEMGYIVRTAGIGKEEVELKRDFNYLVSLYKGILARKEKVKAPAQLYQESDIVIRSIRDYFSTDMDEVLIDDNQVYQQARDFFSLVMPDQLKLVKQHREKRPIFSRYQIEEQIESLARNQVPLPSGGSIVIDQTEALVAIDVNSGRMAGEKGIEATAARSNIEAAAEIGRQLRLRDLGGLIVIDFIDMRDRKKVREVEQTLKESVKDDKARISLGRISQFGLLELSRQRIRPTLSVGAYLKCPHCHGKGQVKSPEAQAVALLRQLHASVSKGQIGTIEAKIPLDVANYLHNEHRQTLSELEKRFDLKIQIHGSLDAIPEQIELELIKREKNQVEDTDRTPVSHADGLEEAMAAANAPVEEQDETLDATEDSTDKETSETEGTSESPSGKRRRRRRRRRRGAASDAAQTDEQNARSASETPAAEMTTEGSESEKEKSVQQPDKPATETAAETATSEATEPASETGAPVEEKPKRRTRRPAAKKTAEATSEATAGKPEVSAEVTAAVEEKPKRRTRKPAAKKTAETASDAAAGKPEVSAEATATTEEKPKRRTRKPAAKKTAEAASEAAAGKPEVSAEATATTEEKPKRRTRKPAAKKTAEAASEAAAGKPEVSAEATAMTEEKPKRRTRKPAAKKTAEAASEAAASKSEVPAETTAAAEEKPKRRTRKPAVKKTAETASDAAASKSEVSAETTAAAEEKPKRRTRKPAAKKTAETAGDAAADKQEVATETTTAVDEKPKRRARKPAAKKSP
jgi:ribonuclease E